VCVCVCAERVFIGHHERLPQCADLLRKPWRYIAEIPYIPLLLSPPLSAPHTPMEAISIKKDLDFLFVGRVHLWAIQRACAVRPWLIRELAHRPRTVLIDIAEELTYGPPLVDTRVQRSIHRSRFCLIARADSYSSGAFYNAIQSGCLPVVISDWFVFSFWWAIPYEKFVIRISEDLFLSNPNEVLDRLLVQYNDDKVMEMQQEMNKWKSALRYDGNVGEITPLNLMMVEMREASLELDLIELEKSDKKKKKTDNNKVLTCFDPILCASRNNGINTITLSGPKINNKFPYLCQHAPRLLGRYKIVYFQKCVKLLWPLRPGNVLKKDKRRGGILAEEEAFLRVFHNISGAASSSASWRVYPPIPAPDTTGTGTDTNSYYQAKG
jgi:hypothetical protein